MGKDKERLPADSGSIIINEHGKNVFSCRNKDRNVFQNSVSNNTYSADLLTC